MMCAAMAVASLLLIACGRDDDKASLGGQGPGGLPTADENDPVPKNVPKDGLIYTGLERGEDGSPCEGMFVVNVPNQDPAEPICSHGPDEAPEALPDVRTNVPLAELKQRDAVPPPPAAENAPPGDGESPSAAATDNTIPCVGSGSDGNRVQAVYAHLAGQPDRLNTLKSSIIRWAGQASGVFNASAAKGGAVRKLRFVTDSGNPGCQVTVQSVELPATADDNFANTVSAMRTAGFSASNRRYLVWMDANVVCGVGQISLDAKPGQDNFNNGSTAVKGAISRVDEQCWGGIEEGGISVEAHELVHNMGGVQEDTQSDPNAGAPNSSGGFHCTDESDTMCYTDTPNNPPMRQICPPASEVLLDCGENDYFSAGTPTGYLASHWNVANSAFLLQDNLGAPINDSFVGAEKLAGARLSQVGDYNQGSKKDSGEPNHAGNPGGVSVWYQWASPGDGNVTLNTAGSSFDTLLGVYTGGNVGALSQVGANDNSGGTQSQVTVPVTAGTVYRIAVDGANGAVGGIALSLNFEQAAQPSGGGAKKKKPAGGGAPKKKKKKKKRKKK